MSKNELCIIGLGRLGMQIANSLFADGHNAILIDKDKEKIKLAAKKFEYVFQTDATNLSSLVELNIGDINTVIVSISDIETSIMTCANLKELKIKNIIARAKNAVHKRVLNTIGVRDIVMPEEVVGKMLAMKIMHNMNADIIALNKTINIVQTEVTNPEIFNKKLIDLNLRKIIIGANIISIQRQDKLIFPVTAETILMQADLISAICCSDQIDNFLKYINPRK